MNDIKLLAFDIDGTLISRKSTVMEESTKSIIKQCEKKGMKVLISTGRSSFFIQKDVIETLNCDYFVTANGGIVTDGKFNTLVKHPISDANLKLIIDNCDKYHFALGLKFEQAIAVYNAYDDFIDIYVKGVKHPDIIFDYTATRDYHLTHGNPVDAFIIGDNDKLQELASKMPQMEWVVAYDKAVECFNKEVSKASGNEYVLNQINLSWENVMAFGDSENDIPMIKKAKYGIAMGNAIDSVKQVANYVTTDCGNHGIANAINHFINFD